MKIYKPIAAPISPPLNRTVPIFKSTVLLRRCASAPEKDDATIWFASVATATAGGMPIKKRRGVIKKPPPTPNIPERIPTNPPRPRSKKALTETSAIGK